MAANPRMQDALPALQVTAPEGEQPAARQLEWELAEFNALRPGRAQLCIWQPQPALVVTALEAAAPGFERAAAAAAGRGFPVHVRRSGGGCVALGPGTLVVSHLYCADAGVERAYRDFAAKLLAAGLRLRAPLRIGQVAGAYCEGRHDLSCRGLKIGGMAQRRSAGTGAQRIWVHAVLSVDVRAADYPLEVQAFHRDLGSPRPPQPALTTVLARCVPLPLAAGLGARLRADLLRLFALPVAAQLRAGFSALEDPS